MLQPADRIQHNLKIIRAYLMKAFPGFGMWDEAEPDICHKFVLTNPGTGEEFKLKVGWARFSDEFDEPALMERVLVYSDVAGKLREEKYYFW